MRRWPRATGTQLREVESGFRHTLTTCFETFPFPRPTPEREAAIGESTAEPNRLRVGWLNPTEGHPTRRRSRSGH